MWTRHVPLEGWHILVLLWTWKAHLCVITQVQRGSLEFGFCMCDFALMHPWFWSTQLSRFISWHFNQKAIDVTIIILSYWDPNIGYFILACPLLDRRGIDYLFKIFGWTGLQELFYDKFKDIESLWDRPAIVIFFMTGTPLSFFLAFCRDWSTRCDLYFENFPSFLCAPRLILQESIPSFTSRWLC